MDERNNKRDLVLAPSEYAYMQDVTKGIVKTYTGPDGDQPDGAGAAGAVRSRDRAVRAVRARGSGAADRDRARGPLPDPEESVDARTITRAPGGVYPVARSRRRPQDQHHRSVRVRAVAGPDGQARAGPPPALEPVPARRASTTRTRRSRTGAQAVIKPAARAAHDAARARRRSHASASCSSSRAPTSRSTSRRPASASCPTRTAQYVRDALTLERLEYCILVDQNGKKRYERGPQVVFPEPTEAFIHGDGAAQVPRDRADRDPGPARQGDRAVHRGRPRPTRKATSCSSPARRPRSTTRARSTRSIRYDGATSTSRSRSRPARAATS